MKEDKRFPFSLFESVDDDWNIHEYSNPFGLSVSEDESHVYVEASLPGIRSDEIEMIFDKGVLWIKAERKVDSEDKKRKYYRKAMTTFSYRVAVPGDVDETKEPAATCKHGILKVSFLKNKKGTSRKIPITEA